MNRFFILYCPTTPLRPIEYSDFPTAEFAAKAISDAHNGLPVFICEANAVVREHRGPIVEPLAFQRSEHHD